MAATHKHLIAVRAGFLISAILAACSLVSCANDNISKGDANYPSENPNPKKFLVFHGTMDSALDINFRVRWRAENPQCRYTVSVIEGARVLYTAWSELAISRQGEKFQARIPIDGVLPGLCRWTFAGVTFGGRTGFRSELIVTSSKPLRPGQSPNGVAVLHCKWKTEPGNVEGESGIGCTWPKEEDRSASVLGGMLWWHPNASDFEVHFIAD